MVFTLQCHIRGYLKGSRGAIQWSLSGTRGSCGGLQCQMRGYLKGSGSAIQWSLSGNIRTWGGLQCHMRGYIGSIYG